VKGPAASRKPLVVMAPDTDKQVTSSKYIWTFLTTILTILTFFFVWTFYNRVKLPYNDEGRYFDETSEMVYLEQTKEVYGVISVIFFGLTLFSFVRTLRTYHK
jgi:hypothetical protein